MKCEGIIENYTLQFEPDSLVKRAKELAEKSHRVYDSVAAVSDQDTSIEILKILTDFDREYIGTDYFILFPQHVSTSQEVRDESSAAEKIVKSCGVELSMRQDVFKKMMALQEKNLPMSSEQKRYLEKFVKEGKRNGLHLSEDIRNEIKSIKNEMNELSIDFSKNLNEDITKIEFSENELDGLPKDFIESLTKNSETGKCELTMKYPHYFPVMQKCKNPDTRRKHQSSFDNRCEKENSAILDKLRKLRQKHAEILGYPNHAAYIHEKLMSKSSENVNKFLTGVSQKLKPLAEADGVQMVDMKKKECAELNLPFNGKLDYWDRAYYANKVEETLYSVDKMKLKEYFPLPVVTKGMFQIYQELLGLTFSEVENPDVWHEDVKLFSVRDTSSEELLGYFYLDLFPRDGKYGHACLTELQPGCLLPDGNRQVSVAVMICNFSKPEADKPSLLMHDEVETYFHEFGHVMHYMCSKAELADFSNLRVERDFVEAPSQMLENWCYKIEPLKRMSSHYKDQSQIPEDMVDALSKSRLANIGSQKMRQIALATFDYKYHCSAEGDVKKLYDDVMKDICNVDVPETSHFFCGFFHMVYEYDAQYYSYMWSEVYSADMFYSRFENGNVLNPEVGMDYRMKILQPAASKDAMDLVKDFLGREPNMNAFMRSLGLEA